MSENIGSRRSGLVEQPLRAAVGLDQLDLLGRAAGELAGSAASPRRRGRSRTSRRTRATCCRSSRGRRAAGSPGPGRRTRRTCSPRRRWRSIWVTVRTRSVAVAPSGSSPVSRKPTTSGISIETGWPSIAASASMPPTPQPSTPRPLIIVVCESVPTSVSGNAWPSRACTTLRQVLEVDLVADPGVRRHDREVVERGLAPAQERVALAVALELQLGVALERARLAEHVDLDRVVDHQLDRHQRVDQSRVAAQLAPSRRASRRGRRSPARR